MDLQWRCDYCLTAAFDTYEAASLHETTCPARLATVNIIEDRSRSPTPPTGRSSGAPPPAVDLVNAVAREVERNIEGNTAKRGIWACDVCGVYQSDDYDEVAEHEKQCGKFGDSEDAMDAEKSKSDGDEEGTADGFSTSTKQGVKRTRWRCDICLDATFDSFSEAVLHEKNCTGRRNDDDDQNIAKKTKKIKDEEKKTTAVKAEKKSNDKKTDDDKDTQKSNAKDQSKPDEKVESSQADLNANLKHVQNEESIIKPNLPPKKIIVAQSYSQEVKQKEKAKEAKATEAKAAIVNQLKHKWPKKMQQQSNVAQLVDSLAVTTSQMPLVKADNATTQMAPQSVDHTTVKAAPTLEPENNAEANALPAVTEEETKEEQAVKSSETTSSQPAVLSAILLLFPLVVAFLYLPGNRPFLSFSLITFPSLTMIAASPIVIIALAYSSFALALAITHQGVHHHRSRGFLLDILTALRDTVLPPKIQYVDWDDLDDSPRPTLREYLNHPDGFSMAFAPAFFGFFAYFGALTALEEETGGLIVPKIEKNESEECGLKSVAGASAGAMAAVMLAAGIQPRKAAEYVCTFNWGMVADPPGLGGLVKGSKFEEFMQSFIKETATRSGDGVGNVMLEDALVSVAVSAFDLFHMKGAILSRGCMAKAARSSAGFPGLFQPVSWKNEDGKMLLIDGGIRDGLGLNGLGAFSSKSARGLRIINMAVGDFGFNGPSGIEDLPHDIEAESLVSIAIVNTPLCGPWAMANGPRAVESARKAMASMLDTPLERGTSKNHYVLRVDASKWLE